MVSPIPQTQIYIYRYLFYPCLNSQVPGRLATFLIKTSAYIFAVVLLASPLLVVQKTNAQTSSPKKVLVLTGYDPSNPGVATFTRSMTSTIKRNSSEPIEFFYEFEENLRIPNAKYESEMVNYLQRKYEGENISLLVSLGAPALRFVLNHESSILRDVPKIYYFHDETEETARNLWPHVTGVRAELDVTNTLNMALALHPGTQNVAVIFGNSNEEKFLAQQARNKFTPYEKELKFSYLTNLTLDELKNSLANLPAKTIAIYLSFYLDRLGNTHSGPEALSYFGPTANAPIYGISETCIGAGIVGGSLLDFEALGNRTGELAGRVMGGEKAENIYPETAPNVSTFDWRELRRWGVESSALPAGSVVKFKEATFWNQYKRYIIAGFVALFFQAGWIVWLLLAQKQRRRAERESERLALFAATEHKRLEEVVSNIPGVVWETRFTADGSFETIYISDYVEKIVGYTTDEWVSGLGLKIAHEDDRQKLIDEYKEAVAQGRETTVQFRWITKDGRTVWVESHMVPVFDHTGTAIGLRGVTLDINEQKLAEAAKLKSEERSLSILQAIPDMMFLQSPDGVYLDYHTNNRNSLLVSPDVFIGKNMREILPPDLSEKFADSFARVTQGEPQIVDYELSFNGTKQFFEARLVLSGQNILSIIRDVTSRKLTKDALQLNEAQLASIISSAMDAIITIDDRQEIVLFNAAAEKMFNYSSAEMLGQHFNQLIPERFHEHFQLSSDKKTNRLVGTLEDIYGRRSCGEEFPLEASISQIELQGGKFLTVILRDLSERKEAEDQLRRSEDRFGKAFRSNPQPMSITTLSEGTYLYVNQSFINTIGYTRDELIGHTSLELNIWETKEAREAFIARLQELGSLANYETRVRIKDGSFRVLLSAAERIEIDNEPCLLIGSSDITERKQAQAALKESEERFRNMADSAPVMIWVFNQDKKFSYLNMRWRDFIGKASDEELADRWDEGIHPDDYDRVVQFYGRNFEQKSHFEIEYRRLRYDGQYRWVFDTGTPRFSSDQIFLGYIGSCIDITERKQSEQALIEAHDDLNKLTTHLEAENIYLQEELKHDHTFGEIVGNSVAIKYVLFAISQVAPTDSTVLILGETGTGKELVARAIHAASLRKDRPLIKVNCGALSPTLIESELFGHEKGAFTGASARKLGRFELANGGTLFLDEIGELPLDLQVKLLRVIQEGELERLGGNKTIKTDVRIIAATNRNLKQEIDNGKFRQDLWYRLNVFPITVPPLRQRKEDIPMLAEHFVGKSAKKFGKPLTSISGQVISNLQSYSWPGNVREFANVIERAVLNSHDAVLRSVDRFEETLPEMATTIKTLEEVEREYILFTLENTGWRLEGPHGAAKILGINPSTLRTRMLKLGIQRHQTSYAEAKSHFN